MLNEGQEETTGEEGGGGAWEEARSPELLSSFLCWLLTHKLPKVLELAQKHEPSELGSSSTTKLSFSFFFPLPHSYQQCLSSALTPVKVNFADS